MESQPQRISLGNVGKVRRSDCEMFNYVAAVIMLFGGFFFGFIFSYLERCRRLFRVAFWGSITIIVFSGIFYDVFIDQMHGFISTFHTTDGLIQTALVFVGFAIGNRLDHYTSPQRKARVAEKVPERLA